MYAWAVRVLSQRAFRRLGEGDAEFAACLLAEDVAFHFPGRNPFTADHRSKEESRRWLHRFAHFRPQFEIQDVIAAGPPWNVRAGIRFRDTIGDPRDGTPYVNEGVCWMQLRWGRVVRYEVFLDTQAVAEYFGTESPDEFFADLADQV